MCMCALALEKPIELSTSSAKGQVHSEFQIREDFGLQP